MESALHKVLSKEDREKQDEISCNAVASTTHREKLRAMGINPVKPSRNADLILFMLWGALIGVSVTLAWQENYYYCFWSSLLTALCFPVALLAPQGDFAKTLEYFLFEFIRYSFGRMIQRKVLEKEGKVDGALKSIYKRLY